MKNLIYILMVIAIIGCREPDEVPTPNTNTTTASIVGTWETTSLHLKLYNGDNLIIDTTSYAPFINETDMIETIRFTSSMVYFKMCNESTEGEYYNYHKSGDYILITEDSETDTLLHIDSLTSTNFDFTIEYYSDIYVDSTDSQFLGRIVEGYKSVKQ